MMLIVEIGGTRLMGCLTKTCWCGVKDDLKSFDPSWEDAEARNRCRNQTEGNWLYGVHLENYVKTVRVYIYRH